MRALVAAGCLLLSLQARADDPGVVPMKVILGETLPLGPAPVRNLICDDASVVGPVDSPAGTALLARSVGSTLCSFTDAVSVRRVFRVTVVPPPPAGATPGADAPKGE